MDAVNIDTSLVKMIDGKFCASFFCSTDQHENQIASFYTGAMANAGELSMRTVPGIKDAMVIVAPNDPGRHGAVRRRVRGDGREIHLGSGPAVRAHGRIAAGERRHRRVHGDRQRLRDGAATPEDRDGRSRHPQARAAAGDHQGREGLQYPHQATASRTCRRSRRIASPIPPASATRFAADS